MSGLLCAIRRLNALGNSATAEPFAGGAGASLTLLFSEETHQIYINDADVSIFDFWWTLLNRPQPFLRMISDTSLDIAEWRRQRETYRNGHRYSKLRRAFAAFYLNRCNRSGIILNGGPIGGINQQGKWKLDARFNKTELKRRCEKIVEYRERIHVSCNDGMEFISKLDTSSTFMFIDPPYFNKGPLLYLNALDNRYHASLAAQLRELSNAAWVLTYDDCPEIRRMYRGWARVRPFSLRYAAAERRPGKEILITPKWMRLPTHQHSAAIKW